MIKEKRSAQKIMKKQGILGKAKIKEVKELSEKIYKIQKNQIKVSMKVKKI